MQTVFFQGINCIIILSLLSLKNKYKKESINYNTMIIQNLKSTYCGYFCIAFLKSNKENKNKGLLQKLKIYQNIFSTDTNKNDNLLVKYFYL